MHTFTFICVHMQKNINNSFMLKHMHLHCTVKHIHSHSCTEIYMHLNHIHAFTSTLLKSHGCIDRLLNSHICTHIHFTHMHVHIHTHAHSVIHKQIHMFTYICTFISHTLLHTHAHSDVDTRAHTFIHVQHSHVKYLRDLDLLRLLSFNSSLFFQPACFPPQL